VIAVDTNILVHAHRFDSPHNGVAYSRLLQLMSGSANWAIPWTCIHEFLGVVTRSGSWAHPTPMNIALEQVEVWRSSPTLELLSEPDTYWDILRKVTETGHVSGARIHDARIAAI
jgi:predicted nucleic acid-binding protein